MVTNFSFFWFSIFSCILSIGYFWHARNNESFSPFFLIFIFLPTFPYLSYTFCQIFSPQSGGCKKPCRPTVVVHVCHGVCCICYLHGDYLMMSTWWVLDDYSDDDDVRRRRSERRLLHLLPERGLLDDDLLPGRSSCHLGDYLLMITWWWFLDDDYLMMIT